MYGFRMSKWNAGVIRRLFLNQRCPPATNRPSPTMRKKCYIFIVCRAPFKVHLIGTFVEVLTASHNLKNVNSHNINYSWDST